jgi:hypothetical protein
MVDLLPLPPMPASLMTRFSTNRAKIPATGLVEVSPSVNVRFVPPHSVHVTLQSLLLPPPLPYLP